MAKEKKIKNDYMKNVFTVYSIWRILQIEVILLLVIGYLDWTNVPSHILAGNCFMLIGVILVGVLLFAICKDMHLNELNKIVVINMYDLCLVITNLFALGYYVFCLLVRIMLFYKCVILLSVYIVSAILLIIRQRNYGSMSKKTELYQGNTVDLKDLYEGKIEKTDEILFLDEKEVDYDLLNRQSIINHLYNVLCTCRPQGQFVISLEGKWGVGKTTILQNVKKLIKLNQKDIVIIDDFDPWIYGNEQCLVDNFFSCLLKNDNLKINSSEIRKSISVLANAIIDSSEKLNLFEKTFLAEKSIKESKEQINEYLRLCGKKVVFFIDNLDRIDDEKVLLLFKMIGTILDFNRVIYVVSYDSDKVRKIFDENLNVDYHYLEKIIQMQINVPENDGQRITDVVQTCTKNLLQAYGIVEGELSNYEEFIDCICENVKDLREYKRIVNSIIVKVLHSNSLLAKRDLLIMEYIKIVCFELYKKIYDNGKFFISEGKMYNQELFVSTIRKDEYERDAKKFFEQLFENEEYCQYKIMLAKIFPNVKKYCDGIQLYGVKTLESTEIEKSRGIASAKYFSLYFSETENEFSLLGGYIQSFVIKQNFNSSDMENDFCKMLKDFPLYMHKEMLEAIQLYLPEFEKKTLFAFLKTLIKNYWEIDDSSYFLALNARQRCAIIIWETLQMVGNEEFLLIIKELDDAYDKLELVNQVSYWFEKDNKGMNQLGRKEVWEKLEDTLVEHVLKDEINLYDDKYYHPRNVWGMCRNLKEQESVFKDYVKSISSHKNIFRILYDVMEHSFGTQHTYYFQSDTIKNFMEEEDIKRWMNKAEATTEDECFIKQVYEKYLHGPQSCFGDEHGISVSEERKFSTL